MNVSIPQSGDLSATATVTFQTFTDVSSSLYDESPSVTQQDSSFSMVESSATNSVSEWTDTGTLPTEASPKTGTLSYVGSSVTDTTGDSSFVHTSADYTEATYSVSTEGISGSTTILQSASEEQSSDAAVSITSSGMLGLTETDPTEATYSVSTEGISGTTTILQSASEEQSSDAAVSITSSGMLGLTETDPTEATYSVSTEGISGTTTILQSASEEQSSDAAVSITSSGMLGLTETDPTRATYLVSTLGIAGTTTILQSASEEQSSDAAVSMTSSGMLGLTETDPTEATYSVSTEGISGSTTILQSASEEQSSDATVSITSSGMLGLTETDPTRATYLVSTLGTTDSTTITQSATVEPSPGVRVSVMSSGMLGSTESLSSLPVLSLDSSPVADGVGGTALSTVQPTTDEVNLIPSTTYNSLILSQDSTGSVETSEPGPSPQSTLFPSTPAFDVGMTTQVYFSPSEQLSPQTIQSTSDVDSSYALQQSLSRTSGVTTLDKVLDSLSISETTGSVVGPPKTNTIQGPSGTGVSFTSASQISPTLSGLSGSSGTVEESTDEGTVLPITMTIVSSEAVSSQESIEYSRFTPAMTVALSSTVSHNSGVTSPSSVESETCVNPTNCQVLTGSDTSIFDESTSILAPGYTSEAVMSSHNNSQTIVQTTTAQETTEVSQQVSVMHTGNASAMSESSQLSMSVVPSSDEITSTSSDLDPSIQTILTQTDNSGLMSVPMISTAPYSQMSESGTLVQISRTSSGQPATTISGSTREPITDSLRTSPTATPSTSSSVAVTNPAPAPAPAPAVHVPDIIFKVYIPAPAPAPPPAPVPAPSPAPTTTSHPPTHSQPETTTETADEANFLSDSMTILIFAGATLLFVGVVVVVVICIVRHYTQSADMRREETLRMVLLPQRWWRNNIGVKPANDVPSYNDDWNSGFNDGNYNSFDLKRSKDQRPSIIPPITDAWF
ncbi:serine-rich adhesin for platelets-like [Lytechinus variegatus]|uniref:serine-rich adhesin for platelets-like n=1 Tax=Lytechinus variegatus TaxID=7654 RepID=UPI001BB21375|nr:serine-rich adhesin for platelets-like [Lytechinus variegatus]